MTKAALRRQEQEAQGRDAPQAQMSELQDTSIPQRANIPHMEPPPPYDAPHLPRSTENSGSSAQDEDGGCLNFGPGQVTGCLNYNTGSVQKVDGCLNYDSPDGCLNYQSQSGCLNYRSEGGCLNYESPEGCLNYQSTGGGCLVFRSSRRGCLLYGPALGESRR